MYIDEDYFRHINNNEFIFFPEEWIRCSDFFTNVKPNYFVSSYGRVFNTKTKQFINPVDSGGSLTLSLSTIDGKRQKFRLHRLVMMCFKPIENSNSYDIKHIDGNKFNNNINNLEWISRSDNMKLSFKNGGSREHLRYKNSIFTNEQVHTICRLLEQRKNYGQICEYLGIEDNDNVRKILSNIKCSNIYEHISNQYNIPNTNRNGQIFTLEEAEFVCQMIVDGFSNIEIYDKLPTVNNNFSKESILKSVEAIRTHRSYNNISCKYNF